MCAEMMRGRLSSLALAACLLLAAADAGLGGPTGDADTGAAATGDPSSTSNPRHGAAMCPVERRIAAEVPRSSRRCELTPEGNSVEVCSGTCEGNAAAAPCVVAALQCAGCCRGRCCYAEGFKPWCCTANSNCCDVLQCAPPGFVCCGAFVCETGVSSCLSIGGRLECCLVDRVCGSVCCGDGETCHLNVCAPTDASACVVGGVDLAPLGSLARGGDIAVDFAYGDMAGLILLNLCGPVRTSSAQCADGAGLACVATDKTLEHWERLIPYPPQARLVGESLVLYGPPSATPSYITIACGEPSVTARAFTTDGKGVVVSIVSPLFPICRVQTRAVPAVRQEQCERSSKKPFRGGPVRGLLPGARWVRSPPVPRLHPGAAAGCSRVTWEVDDENEA
ncbi:hypothetical protein DIPPA_08942 [Diplonema papillatum]|nr:hypothetical protein DIPPA_08942 [Diplonema papillatum]